MKSDRRVIYTKRVIKESLLNLLESNPLSKITIKEICNDAEINRGTFYRHYEDIYDLFEEIESEFIDQVYLKSEEEFSINTLLNLIYTNQGFYREFFFNHLESERIKNILEELMIEQPLSKDQHDHTAIVALNKFMYYGITGLIKEWVNGGCKISPIEFETIVMEVINKLPQ
jgi:AcrR family transcriptional regulator